MLKVRNLCHALSFSGKVCIIFPFSDSMFLLPERSEVKMYTVIAQFPWLFPPYFCTRTLWVQLFMCKFTILHLGFRKIRLELWLQLTHRPIVNRTRCVYTCCHSFAAYFIGTFGRPLCGTCKFRSLKHKFFCFVSHGCDLTRTASLRGSHELLS